ncbi:ABC-type dipeptide transport system; periplasmatic component [Desulforapulum autotrophicum HRM2]|uniref:ABC-type dipeptide transport system periplasmatic component n=1 Tax=Desulforapulum autotrophicum (strain ATCC 43914 / DSM 3382 / VKM B-1955 / HRM2) TaxID=177437 RepID=C0QEX2_DESAH|nr:ABC transporter substrate-binding protein [Desulforapulum autotrophicum]ACN17473.1 ABC-type dipeptide transport system; periplasmatic component [Desulforapulum autotrophicum HRM2]
MKSSHLYRFILGWIAIFAIISSSNAMAATATKIRIGSQPVNALDPHFIASIADILVTEQMYHHLTFIDPSNNPVSDLALSWESPDGKVWTFTLDDGPVFSNGTPVTAKDVVFSYNRLRDPKIGAPTVKLYENVSEITALDDHTVRFTLNQPNPDFPSDAGDFHACVIPDGTKNPGKAHIGSGPYMIKSYFPEDRLILKKNPHFKGKVNLDEIHFIFSPDIGGQIEALRGGELDFVGGLTTEFAETIKNASNTKLLLNSANMHWVIHMRSDAGHVAADSRVRKALKLATDHQSIINAVRPGLASVGNGFSPVGPAFAGLHLVEKPVMDLEKAKALLAEAGFAKGLTIDLVAQNQLDVIPIATVWKEQMSKIGVTVNIQVIPTDVYYGEGENSWLKCDFGITDWGSRATPVTYFNLAYVSDGPWSSSHWKDAEFDDLVHQVGIEMKLDKRTELYHKLQRILIDRGPVIVPYFEKAVVGVSKNLNGVELPSDWARTRFWNASITR